jgi:hypothetical protein
MQRFGARIMQSPHTTPSDCGYLGLGGIERSSAVDPFICALQTATVAAITSAPTASSKQLMVEFSLRIAVLAFTQHERKPASHRMCGAKSRFCPRRPSGNYASAMVFSARCAKLVWPREAPSVW